MKIIRIEGDMVMAIIKVCNRTVMSTAKRYAMKFLRGENTRNGSFRMSKDLLGSQKGGREGRSWQTEKQRQKKA